MKTEVTGSDEVDAIYLRMSEIRRDRRPNVRESVAGAEAIINWGRYVRAYPWVAMGAAAAIGCLLYAAFQRRSPAKTASGAERAKVFEPLGETAATEPERSNPGTSFLSAAWGFVLPVAVRAGQGWALHWLEQHFRTISPSWTAPSPSSAAEGRPSGWSVVGGD